MSPKNPARPAPPPNAKPQALAPRQQSHAPHTAVQQKAKTPAAPQVYRPQPVPRCLQAKPAVPTPRGQAQQGGVQTATPRPGAARQASNNLPPKHTQGTQPPRAPSAPKNAPPPCVTPRANHALQPKRVAAAQAVAPHASRDPRQTHAHAATVQRKVSAGAKPAQAAARGPSSGAARGPRVIQRMMQNNPPVDVWDVGYTQSTIGPNFTSLPDNVPKHLKNLDSSADNIKNKGGSSDWLTNISVFKITSPTSGLSRTFTLDNRRRYVIENAGIQSFVPNWASFEQVYGDLYKITAQDDWASPTVTSTAQERNPPPNTTILGEFVAYILNHFNANNVAALPAWGAIQNRPQFVQAVTQQFSFNQ